ncbi:hypothetical protein CW304_28950 [Bacillus sp. UFRGS-B20]|nr:hypothetical protein CW304_28950 [Bacillus sp. UFRGS-B20]
MLMVGHYYVGKIANTSHITLTFISKFLLSRSIFSPTNAVSCFSISLSIKDLKKIGVFTNENGPLLTIFFLLITLTNPLEL